MSRLTTGDPVAAAAGIGARPTACCNDSPGATDTVAPGREAAASASCGLTARVAEPLWPAAGATMCACACACGSGLGPPAPAAGVRTTPTTAAHRPATAARWCFFMCTLLLVWLGRCGPP